VLLSPEQRQVLAVADGRHRREEIAQALAVAAGQRGPPEGFAEGAHALPPLSTPQVDEVLRQLARCALLEA
jgi:hypothetical protein